MDSAAGETVGEGSPSNAVAQILLIHALFLWNVYPSSILFEILNEIQSKSNELHNLIYFMQMASTLWDPDMIISKDNLAGLCWVLMDQTIARSWWKCADSTADLYSFHVSSTG